MCTVPALTYMVLTGGGLPPGDVWSCLETFLGVRTGGVATALPPVVHKSAPRRRINCLKQQCCRGWETWSKASRGCKEKSDTALLRGRGAGADLGAHTQTKVLREGFTEEAVAS